ncbi:MAG: restriction endonuclease subunit S [Thermodesulfobacteriota bacterium]
MIPIYEKPLPALWEEEEIRQVTVRKRGYSWAKEDEVDRQEAGTVPVIRIPNIQKKLDLANLLYLRNVSMDALRQSAVSKGWVLFVGSNGNPDRIGDSALMVEDRPMVFASFLMGIAPKEPDRITPEFLDAWLRLHSVHEAFSKTSQQTTGLANFSWSAVKRLSIRFPTGVKEQAAITRLFQVADDALAAAEAKLTAARRLKTALMQQLFTRGIPGRHIRFKQTKIGEIPEEWEIFRLGELLQSTQYGLSESFGEHGRYQILRMTNIENGYVHLRDPVFVDLDDAVYEQYKLEVGDILFNRTNTLELVGRVGIVREPNDAVFASYLVRLRANIDLVNPFYLNLCLNCHSVRSRYKRFATPAVAQANINPTNLKKTLVAIPPLSTSNEQQQTVAMIESIDAAIEATGDEIRTLERLKRSLLQDLLTGKVRVKPLEKSP